MIELANGRLIGEGYPVYVIAEIGSNFDGSIDRAKNLIKLAKSCGADCAKFQTFSASNLINPEMKAECSFQARWGESVYKTYEKAELPREWLKELSEHCRQQGIDFASTPYDFDAVDLIDSLGVPFFKIGSGEITNLAIVRYLAYTGRPIFIGTGASNIEEVYRAVKVAGEGSQVVVMQCTTSYPAPIDTLNIRTLLTFKKELGSEVEIGFSDHSRGFIGAVCAVAIGAVVIEKHFTDDNSREGPDHFHSSNPDEFGELVEAIRIAEKALGRYEKRVEQIEYTTRIAQRRNRRTQLRPLDMETV